MDRPKQFADHQYVGDKRTQVVYDVDALSGDDEALLNELMEAQTYICFGPDTLAEARNRGYRPAGGQAWLRPPPDGVGERLRFVCDQLSLAGYLAERPAGRSTQHGVVLCHGYPNKGRGAENSGKSFPELADRLSAGLGWPVLALNFRGCATIRGQLRARRLATRHCGGHRPADRSRGPRRCGWLASAPEARCASVRVRSTRPSPAWPPAPRRPTSMIRPVTPAASSSTPARSGSSATQASPSMGRVGQGPAVDAAGRPSGRAGASPVAAVAWLRRRGGPRRRPVGALRCARLGGVPPHRGRRPRVAPRSTGRGHADRLVVAHGGRRRGAVVG